MSKKIDLIHKEQFVNESNLKYLWQTLWNESRSNITDGEEQGRRISRVSRSVKECVPSVVVSTQSLSVLQNEALPEPLVDLSQSQIASINVQCISHRLVFLRHMGIHLMNKNAN